METIGLAEVAAVLADPSRATMCLALLDGRAWTVGELAKAAGIALSTASEHVTRLVDARFVERVKQGRTSFVRIADPHVAELIEHLAQHAEHRPPRTLRSSLRARRLGFARTCYDHLAGVVGVELHNGMLAEGLIDRDAGLSLTERGRDVLTGLGVETSPTGRRPLLRECLDWTERREHFSCALPAALLARAIEAGWVSRSNDRAVKLQPAASEPFAALGVDLDALAS